jgi:hypothetical protein
MSKTVDQNLNEDGDAGGAPVNTAGSGAVAGIGVGAQGEPGVNPKHKAVSALLINMLRRKRTSATSNS